MPTFDLLNKVRLGCFVLLIALIGLACLEVSRSPETRLSRNSARIVAGDGRVFVVEQDDFVKITVRHHAGHHPMNGLWKISGFQSDPNNLTTHVMMLEKRVLDPLTGTVRTHKPYVRRADLLDLQNKGATISPVKKGDPEHPICEIQFSEGIEENRYM